MGGKTTRTLSKVGGWSKKGRVMRRYVPHHDMEREGVIGSLHDVFYTTVGNGTAVAKAKEYGAEIAMKLQKAGVTAAIFTST